MVDLHTHTILSDGDLLPSELVRRAEAKGLSAIAITDHADSSNIDFIVPRIARACKILNKYWKIKAIPGVEITHAPVETIKKLVRYARRNGAKIVVGHGETVSEPVLPGTNRAYIEAGADILAHPGMISLSDIRLAAKKKVYLEITTRKSHSRTNRRLAKLAFKNRAELVLNTDSHSPDDILEPKKRIAFLRALDLKKSRIARIIHNSYIIASRA